MPSRPARKATTTTKIAEMIEISDMVIPFLFSFNKYLILFSKMIETD